MKFFVSVSSKASARFANTTRSPRVKHFSAGTFEQGVILPKESIKDFKDSDVLILNGTWGNDLRKELYLEKCEDTHKYKLFSPSYIDENSRHIPYKIRSAILDEINTSLFHAAKLMNKPVVVFESATTSRSLSNYDEEYNLKSMFRIGLESWIYGEGTWLQPKDFEYQPTIKSSRLYNHSWKINKKGSIYVLTGLETDPTSTKTIEDFLLETISKIRNKTDREIVVKLHPACISAKRYEYLTSLYENVRILEKNTPLRNLYNDMYCCVIDNSTSIFELIDAGIPTFCSNVNFGKDLCNIDINNIENPHLHSKEKVLDWVNKMCCTELPVDLLDDEEFMRNKIRALLENNKNDRL